jgi:DNA-binding response OmpR family regulator
MRKVLVVEDDQAMAIALRDGFEYEGYAVTVARDGTAGLRLASEKGVDLVILDVMLPKMSGLDVCKQLRSTGNGTPIIMLTARGQEIDKVLGLKCGADDYVTKPFSFLELMARVEAVLRRASKKDEQLETYQFKLLKYFIEHRGEAVSRDQLLDSVWSYHGFPLTRTVDMHIAKLRQKIEDSPADPRYIITVHRVGYKFTG